MSLEVAKALSSDFQEKCCKNGAKEKFIRIQSNGWFLFNKKGNENFKIKKKKEGK